MLIFTETSNSTTTQSTSTNSSSVKPDGEGNNGSQTEPPTITTDSIANITPNSSPISAVTDSDNNHSASMRTSSVDSSTMTPVSSSSTAFTQKLPTTGETTALFLEESSAQNSSSISITVVSVIAGCIFVLLHIVILAIVIYLCYRAKTRQKSGVANVESVLNNRASETNQPTVYESIYARAVPTSCTNISEPVDLEEADQYTYESSNYTLPVGIHGALPVVFNQNPAYGCNDQIEFEDPLAYASNSVNKGHKTNSYTMILPPTP